MANEGISKLAGVFQKRMQENQDANSELVLDFGTIQNDYSLLTNTFPIAIPRSDYYVCRSLTLGAAGATLGTTSSVGDHTHGGSGSHSHSGGSHDHSGGQHEKHEEGDGGHSHSGGSHDHSGGDHTHNAAGGHSHSLAIPEKMRSLLPGDRVLVAWVQSDAVVIDIIV